MRVSPEKQKRLIDFTNMTDASGAVEPTLLQSDDAMHATTSVTLEQDDKMVPSDEIIIDDDDQFLSEFRAYLKKWVCNSPTGPLESNLKKVTDYFIRLYNSKRSDILFVIFLGLRRHILNHQRCMGWSAAFNHLLEAIQSRVQLDYNGTLPVEKISI